MGRRDDDEDDEALRRGQPQGGDGNDAEAWPDEHTNGDETNKAGDK